MKEASQRQHHDDITRAVASERGSDEANIIVEGASGHDDASRACRAGENLGAERPDGEVAVDDGEMIEGLHRSVRIVDRWREGLAGNVGLLPDAKPNVLFDGALEANSDVGEDRGLKGLGARLRLVRRGCPYPAKDCSCDQVLPDPGGEGRW